MKRVSTVAAQQIRNFSPVKLTTGLELRDRSSWYQQRRRSLFAQAAGTRSAAHSGIIRCGLRSEALGPAAGGAGRQSGKKRASVCRLKLVGVGVVSGMRVPARGAIFRAQRVPKSIYKRDLS